jgi:peroxiredoxin
MKLALLIFAISAALGLGLGLTLEKPSPAARALAQLPPPPPSLTLGTRAPAVTLRDEAGEPVALGTRDGRATLLMVFRGSWCPFCRAQLMRLGEETRRLPAAGVRVFAISSDAPEAHARLKRNLGLPFTLLSDPDAAVAAGCGATHCLLLFDRGGVLRWGSFSDNWRRAPPYADVLRAAHQL